MYNQKIHQKLQNVPLETNILLIPQHFLQIQDIDIIWGLYKKKV